MPELETPPEAPPEQPPAAQEITSPYNEDGTLAKDWHTMAPEGYEELRESKTLPRIKKFWELAKTYENVRKQVPLNKTAIPDDTWGETEWDEWYRLSGRPDTAADYQIKKPEEMPEDMWNQDVADAWQEFFFKHGASKKLVDAINARNNELTLQAMKDVEQQNELEFNTLKDNLTKKWGMAYDQKVHLGNIAIEKGSKEDPEYKARLIEKINKDPDLIEFASNLGNLFAEHKLVEDVNIPTPGDIQQQITKLMADPRYTHRDQRVRQPLIDQVLELRKQLNKK